MHGAGVSVSPASAQLALMDHGFRVFDHWVPMSAGWPKGVRSAGYTDKPSGWSRYVNTPTGANKMFEVVDYALIYPDMTTGWGANPILFKMILNAANGNSFLAGECFQGIEIGSFGVGTPWQTNYAIGTCPCMQLRYNFVLTRWEVCVWDGDSATAPDIVACSVQPGFAVDLGVSECVMHYLPRTGGGSVLNCYINGTLVHSYTGARLDNITQGGTTEPMGCGYFLTNGSNAGAQWSEGGFYGGRIFEPYRSHA